MILGALFLCLQKLQMAEIYVYDLCYFYLLDIISSVYFSFLFNFFTFAR